MFHIQKWKEFLIWAACIVAIYAAIPGMLFNYHGELLEYFPKSKVNLGLDLKGGVSLLLEADLENYKKEMIQHSVSQIKGQFKQQEKRAFNLDIQSKQDEIVIKISEKVSVKATNDIIERIKSAVGNTFHIDAIQNLITLSLNKDLMLEAEGKIMDQSIEIIRRRIDEKGAKEIDLQRQGTNYILLQVPGAESPDQIKRLLGKTAKLSFHLVDPESNKKIVGGYVPSGFKVLPIVHKDKNVEVRHLIVESESMLTGDMLTDAQVSVNASKPVVNFKLNSIGSKIFANISSKNTGKALAIVLDGEIISAPVINEPIIGGSGVISGNFSMEDANELALLLRSGALATPLTIIEERVVGPNLGSDSIDAGRNAIIAGAVIVTIFMILFYGLFGLIADLALIMNVFFIFALLGILDATLTLPGLAGIVLTLGMAVDSNVLICERIKEELRAGKKMVSAITNGYKAAFLTIVDANITTIIAGLALYFFGSGPVKGFAVTLIIGIISSMFTAILFSKVLLTVWYRIFKLRYMKLL